MRATGDPKPNSDRAETAPGRTPGEDGPGLLFVCGCDRSGTTTFTDYLNRHPEMLVCQERFKATVPHERISPDLFTFERILDFRPGEAENPIWKNGRERFVNYHRELLARKDPERLRWIGDKNPNYVRRLKLIAGNNPGARFIVMHRPVEEVAESWEARARDPEDHWKGDRGYERAVETWNLALTRTREFVESSPAPRLLIVGYHDFFDRTEAAAPLISRFLGIDLDEADTRAWAENSREFRRRRRPKEVLGPEQRSFVQEHADRTAEAWVLDRIAEQRENPALYVQEDTKAALTASLNETEAKTWRLQQRVDELESNLARRRREVDDITGSRSWRLLSRINGVRARIAGRKAPRQRGGPRT